MPICLALLDEEGRLKEAPQIPVPEKTGNEPGFYLTRQAVAVYLQVASLLPWSGLIDRISGPSRSMTALTKMAQLSTPLNTSRFPLSILPAIFTSPSRVSEKTAKFKVLFG
jgi:hypothetical protein